MNSKYIILCAVMLAAAPCRSLLADDPPPAPEGEDQPAQPLYSPAESFDEYVAVRPSYPAVYDPYYSPTLVGRFGWWGISTDGSNNKVGEWQDLDSGAFWDVDGLTSDGYRTYDFNFTGTDNETSNIHFNYFQPEFSSKVRFNRFLHRLDHDPFQAIPKSVAEHDAGEAYIGPAIDFNAGEDYAIRVETLDARFKGRITDNIRWRLNVWGMRKFGERQGRALNHNCREHQCHIQAQRQTIDWLTMEIEPVIEARLGENATIEYSRTMRGFEQSDGVVTRAYPEAFPTRFISPTDQYAYATVPENYTQIDRLKFRWQLGTDTHLYAFGYIGDTNNKNRNTHRQFHGFDARLTNTSLERTTVTGYFKWYEQDNELPRSNPEVNDFQPGTFNPDPATGFDPDRSLDPRRPVDRRKIATGLRGRWRPFERGDYWDRVSFGSGYEYRTIDRDHVLYDITAEGSSIFDQTEFFHQPTTVQNAFFVDTYVDWTPTIQTYARYTMRQTRNPLFGVRENTESAGEEIPDADIAAVRDAVNTNLPEHENLIELGGTWIPTDRFLLNGTVGLLMRDHRSEWANFSEDDYPITLSASYLATDCWAIHGGVAFLSNYVRQNSTIGINHISFRGSDIAENVFLNYAGRSHVINLGTTYSWTERLVLSGLVEYVGSLNKLDDPTIFDQDLSLIPYAMNVSVRTTRFNAGIDYLLSENVNCYFRYNYYDWADRTIQPGSGTAHMFLAGVSAVR